MTQSAVSLATADVHTLIGDAFADGQNGGEGGFGHVVAHAVVGCLAAEAGGASCSAGALGGAAQSLYAGTDPATRLTPEQVERTARLIGAAVGFVASEGQGENVSTAASVAASGARNNYLWHYQADMLERAKADLAACKNKETCSQKQIDFLEDRVAYFEAVDEFTDAELKRACGGNPTGSDCQAIVSDAMCAEQSLTGSACGGSPLGASRWGYKSPSDVSKLTRFEAGKARPGDALAHNADRHHEHVTELLAKYPEAVEHARQRYAVSTAAELVVGVVGAKAGVRVLGRYGLTTWPKGVAGSYGERLYQVSRLDLDRAVGQAGGANRTVDIPGSSTDLSISQADLFSIQTIQPGKSGMVVINGKSTLVTKGPDGRIVDATPVDKLPTVAEAPGPLPPEAPSDPWWAKAIKQLEGMMDDL